MMMDGLTLKIQMPDVSRLGAAALRLNEALQPIREQLAELSRRLKAAYPQMLRDADKLGQIGWTVPMWGTPRLISYLVHEVGQDGVDEYFLAEYKGPRAKASTRLLESVMSAPLLQPWRAVLDQALSAYRSGLSLVVVPALLPVLEGALATAAGEFERRPNVRRQSQLLAASTSGDVDKLVLVSVDAFVRDLFESTRFADSPPTRLNRHWILHGRSPGNWTTADALRLFQALDSLAAVARRNGRSRT